MHRQERWDTLHTDLLRYLNFVQKNTEKYIQKA